MECVLQGVIETKHVAALEHLVRAMTGARPRQLFSLELIYRNAPTIGTGPCELRVSHALGAEAGSGGSWSIVHEGLPMRGAEAEKLGAQVRTILRADASSSVQLTLTALGLRVENEYVLRGNVFVFRHRGSILTLSVASVLTPVSEAEAQALAPGPDAGTVVRIWREEAGKGSPSLFAPVPGLSLVDLTTPATPENYALISSTLVSFSDMLALLVRLSKAGAATGIPATAAAVAASIAPAP